MSLSLEHIYALPQPSIDQINQRFQPGKQFDDFLTSRLISTIHLHNNNRLDPIDSLHLKNPIFNSLYLSPDIILIQRAQTQDIYVNEEMTRFQIIRNLTPIPKEEPIVHRTGKARFGGLFELVNPEQIEEANILGREIDWQNVTYLGRPIKSDEYQNLINEARDSPNEKHIYLGYVPSQDIFLIGFKVNEKYYYYTSYKLKRDHQIQRRWDIHQEAENFQKLYKILKEDFPDVINLDIKMRFNK